MFFSSRTSRQPTPEEPPSNPGDNNDKMSTGSSSSGHPDASPVDTRGDVSEPPSSSTPNRRSRSDYSEGYPSWLPRRPPPPAPGSTFHSSNGGAPYDPPSPGEPSSSAQAAIVGGRKPTPRSVRIVSLQDSFINVGPEDLDADDRREPTDQTRVSQPQAHARAWSRGTAMPAAMFAASGLNQVSPKPQPKFNTRGLHIELLRNPSWLVRAYFYLWPLLVLWHIPLQTFFDFNTAFMLIQVSKFPNPQSAPGTGKNWALASAAYVACWLAWIFVVCLVYELVYSFIRRWRVRRPLMVPIYLSAPAFNYASMTSYTTFSFLHHIRYTAFFNEEHGSLRDGLAETFNFYSQNLPTVALLLPRAGMAMALLFSFSSLNQNNASAFVYTTSGRDSTFFHQADGTLTGYAKGILYANAAWTAWRFLVLVTSWIGLWILSGSGCAGLCGPRDKWEEEDVEKITRSTYVDNTSAQDELLPWQWRECTRLRVNDAYEFCMTVHPGLRWSRSTAQQKEKQPSGTEGEQRHSAGFEGLEKVLAAVGFPSIPPLARRGALSDDLFESPRDEKGEVLSDIIPAPGKRSSRDRIVASAPGVGAPLMQLPYPFTKPGSGQVSSKDNVPFPPTSVESLGGGSDKKAKKKGSKTTTATNPSGSGSGISSASATTEEEEEEEEEEEDEEDDDEEEEDEEYEEEPSMGRASGSMSSLGQPIPPSRYPFNIRQSGGRGNSMSSHGTRSGGTRSFMSQSTGNRESTDSQRSPISSNSERGRASLSQGSVAGIPMPPRHPHPQQQVRGRAETEHVRRPSGAGSTPPPIALGTVEFPSVSRRRRVDSGVPGVIVNPSMVYGEGISTDDEDVPQDIQVVADDDDEEDEEEDDEHGERADRVGLLSVASSPRTSLLGRRTSSQRLSLPGSGSGSRASSASRSRASSGRSRSSLSQSRPESPTRVLRERASSLGVSLRERASSIVQSVVGAASMTSLELPGGRSRANSSMARLEEENTGVYASGRAVNSGGSGSGSGSSGSGRGRLAGFGAAPEAEEYYSSSGGTHSRSGSESVNGENYTFGRPMPFLRPQQPTPQVLVEGEELRSQPALENEAEDEHPAQLPEPQQRRISPPSRLREEISISSLGSDQFYSLQPSERTVSPVDPGMASSSPSQESEQNRDSRVGIDIPWSQGMLEAPAQRRGAARGAQRESSSSSPDMISTAAGSFVTAAATLGGSTTTATPSFAGQTESSSWEAAGRRRVPTGGMVERPGEDMGAGGDAWRIV